MPKRENYDKGAVARLFAAQGGLATRAQLMGLGVPPSTIRHRERPGGPWPRVLRGVCANQDRALAGLGRLRAAQLFAGPGSVVTGLAALRAHRIVAGLPPVGAGSRGFETGRLETSGTEAGGAEGGDVKVLIPGTRRRASTGFVLVARTRRMPVPVEIEGIRVAPIARAAVDACLETKDTELMRQIITELVHSGRSSPGRLRAELDAHPRPRSAAMRAVLVEFADGVRTGAEAQCRSKLARVAAPRPQWNRQVLQESTGRVAVLPGALWPERGIALQVEPAHVPDAQELERLAARRRWMAAVLRLTVTRVTPSQVRDRWEEVWSDLRGLLERPPTYRLPPGYVFA
jgi:hypothetical protein